MVKNEERARCPLCGGEFDVAAAACSGCPLRPSCTLVRCPWCGYEQPGPTRLSRWLERFAARKEHR